MKKKFLGRVLTMLLVASMVFTLLPAPAIAAGNWWWNNDEYTEEAVPTATTTADANYHYNIFFLDCGRKYYSVESIKQLIDNASAAGFNYIQLAVGNDGLRFLLDDMLLTVNGTTYGSDAVKAAIHAGNEAYYNFPVDELTESEMNDIIAYANTKGMGVIPCVNTPGHMDAILSAATSLTGKTCSYSGSVRTIDVTNETAVAFTQALLQKYITYFAGKGCQLFNMGADEYANDKFETGSMGFGNLQNSGNYSYYVNYVNEVAAMIKKAKMKPMAFNDGIYFNNNTSSGTFDTDIIICYWSNGWSGYTPMPASSLAGMGFKLVNTHGDYYWVIGKSDWQCSPEKASGFNYKEFQGGTIDSPAGSMFCIWGDYPGALTENQVIDQTAATIAAFKEVLPAATPDTTTPTPPDGGTTPPETITVPVNGTKEITVDGNVTVTTGSDYKAGIATYESKTTTETTETPVTSPVGKSFYIRNMSGTTGTMYLDDSANWQSDISNAEKWICREYGSYTTSYYYLELDGASQKTYLYLDNGQWKTTNYSYYRTYFYFDSTSTTFKTDDGWDTYTLGTPVEVKTDSTPKTTVTFKGLAEGTTYVTIGNVKYTIKVTDEAPDTALTGNSITLEYWITNNPVYNNKSKSAQSQLISASIASDEQGVEIKSLAPEPAYSFFDGTVTVYYWQAVRLDSAHKQTDKGGVDQTAAGTTLTHVRYQNSAWQYKTLDGTWRYFESGDQLVAYYLQKTEVTKEITTYTKDWGYGTSSTTPDTSSGNGQAALTVAVVYPDGTVSPAEGEMYSKSTTIFNYWDNRNIGIVSPANNSDYDISKITVTSGTRTSNTSANQWYTSDTITWDKKLTDDGKTKWYNETVVWDEQTNAGTTPMVNGSDPSCKEVCTWSAKNTAKLVLIYLKPVHKETNLNLVYYDRQNSKEITRSEIAMSYETGAPVPSFETALMNGGKVIGNTKDWPGTTNTEAEYLPDTAYVTNSSGVDQQFNKVLTTVPNIGAEYKTGLYKYDGAQISEDGKTLTLYYVIDQSKLKATYVFDFSLPFNIPLSDIVKNADDIQTISVSGKELSATSPVETPHGELTLAEGAIVYRPVKTWDKSGASALKFKFTFKGGSSQDITIGVLPASNVLYEENFLTEAPASSGLSWKEGTPAELGSQETQKVNGTGSYNVFGRDTAYDTVTGELGAWTADGLAAGQGATKDLSTEFYGNGFDLIGNCGPDTGRVFLFISGANQIKLVDVDTRYSGGTFNQVPLAHVMLEQEANYQVKVSAAGLNATDTTSASYSLSGAATYASDYAVGGYDADLYNVLAENGLTMADVEYVKVESAPAATARSAAPFYALDTAAVGGAAARPAGTHVEIDGFRVYRSSANNTNYPKSEQDVRYLNILGAVDSFTAFVEGSAADSEWKARDKYESAGGPQNEIYLRETNGKNSAIAFKTEIGEVVQISARAVENNKPATLVVNGVATVIETNTEMYYTFTPDENGIVTIKNTGKGMLALGNLKIKKGTQVAALSEEDYPAAIALLSLNAAPETPDEGFNPAINAKVTTTRFIRSKVVTLTVSASSDVAVLEVNGVELRPTNSWLVKMGWSDTYTYILTEKVQKNEIKTYEIVGYRADGAASETIVVKSK